MHDPKTVAFKIRYPWRKYPPGKDKLFPKGYRESFITVWHVDPEINGYEDSCGYIYPNVTGEHAKEVEKAITNEFQLHELFEEISFNRFVPKYDVLTMLYSAYSRLCWWMLHKKDLRTKDLDCILGLAYNHSDNLRGYCDRERRRIDPMDRYEVKRFYWLLARQVLYVHRKWWQHPRWHIHHWKLQIHPWQHFTRWAFSRCAGCGKRFS